MANIFANIAIAERLKLSGFTLTEPHKLASQVRK